MDIKNLYKKYSLNTYNRLGPVFVKGKGSYLFDDKGNRYLDMFPGWGVSILGHCHPRIVAVLKKQASTLIHLPNNLFQQEQALLAREIVKNSFPSKVFFSNSGAEAVEGAVKLSRLYGRGNRHEVIAMRNSFHGRTFAALSVTGQEKYKKPFTPILPGCKEAAFNDFSDFVKKVSKKTVAVIIELVQGEGGVNIATTEYIKQLYGYCRQNDILFIVDEVQTGMGRTGKLFCYQNYGISPDIMILSKGLGAGVPIGAFVVAERISNYIKPGLHASTFGGSPLVTAVSLEVFKTIKEEKLLKNVLACGRYLALKLKGLKNITDIISEVRSFGLMTALEINGDSSRIFEACLNYRLIVNATHGNVLRILPALNVTEREIDQAVIILEKVFLEHNKKTRRKTETKT